MAFKNFTAFWILSVLGMVSGCRVGGEITAVPTPTPSPVPQVEVPTIATPGTSPYYSNTSSIEMTGMCMEGEEVYLEGDVSNHQTCVNSSYSFPVNKTSDGVYSFTITQIDSLKNVSNPVSFIWVRKSSVSSVVIQAPQINPYLSAESALTLSGTCETGATVSVSGGLAGGGSPSTVCVASSFAFSIPVAVDGDYSFQVGQTDLAGNSSRVPLTWKKHAISLTPTQSTLVVKTPQQLSLSGGTGVYTLTVQTNRSGGTLDTTHQIYTPGPLANVTDILQLQDSLGAQTTASVTTQVATRDHLVIGGGNNQLQTIGSTLSQNPKVQIVDAYGNGIPGETLYFHLTSGDARLTSAPIQVSDANGYASVSVQLGLSSLSNTLFVSLLSGVLPDTAGTGHATLTLTESAQVSSPQAKFGLNFPTGNGPQSLLVAGVTGASHADAVVLNQSDSTVGVFIAQGKGLYGSMVTTHLPNSCDPSGMVSGDFDGDGKLDLAVTCNGSDSVIILLGNGDGNFRVQTGFTTASGPGAIAVGDFDGDGKLDLAVAANSGTTHVVRIHYGNGQGSFTTNAYDTVVGRTPVALAVADLNLDGSPDLVVANLADNTIGVLLNTQLGSSSRSSLFHPMVSYTVPSGGPVALAVGDFNGDGAPDVMVAENPGGSGNSASLFLNNNNGTGTLQSGLEYSVGNSPTSLTVADINGDGHPDLLVTNSQDGTLGVLLGLDLSLGQGPLALMTTVTTAAGPSVVAVADGNGDGKLDAFVLSSSLNEVQFLPGDKTGNFGFRTQVGTNPVASVAADFDGDGITDIAVVDSANNQVKVFKGLGNGLFQSTPLATLATGNTPVALVAGDFNEDGVMDLAVVSSGAGTVGIFLGSGSGNFKTRMDFSVGTGVGSTGIVAADFDGDGHLDLAVINGTTNKFAVLIGDGSGNFLAKTGVATGAQPSGIAAGDFNGDGKVDLAITNGNDNTVSVYPGLGDGTFQTPTAYAVGNNPTSVVAGDFYNSGMWSLVVLNSADGNVSVLQGDGQGGFVKSGTSYSVGATPVGLATGDFNGDGKLDLVVTNGISGGFTVLLNTSNGTFNSQVQVTDPSPLGGLALGDFNGDGKLDLALIDPTEGFLLLWTGW